MAHAKGEENFVEILLTRHHGPLEQLIFRLYKAFYADGECESYIL